MGAQTMSVVQAVEKLPWNQERVGSRPTGGLFRSVMTQLVNIYFLENKGFVIRAARSVLKRLTSSCSC